MKRELQWFLRAFLLVVACYFVAAPCVRAQVSYTVSFSDPNNYSTAQDQANLSATIQATGADWARYFQSSGSVNLSVQVQFSSAVPRTTGASGTSEFVATVNNIDIYEQSAATKIRTGSTPFTPPFDVVLMVNPDYLHNNLFFEADPSSRSASIPTQRTDAYSVFAHELGHAFAFNGWRNPDGTLTTPANPRQYQSTWDRWIAVEPNGDILSHGPNAMSVYGGPVPVTNGNPNHYGNSAASGRPGADLVPGLMNGVVFNYQTRYSIGALDLAIAKDAGLILAPFRWTGGSGDWSVPANWNADPAAGPNAIVPNGMPFDARIAQAGGSPYTVTLSNNVSLNTLTLASSDATLRHTSGTFSASVVSLDAGTYQIDGGVVVGGSWTSSGGRLQATANTLNTIQGATLGSSVLDLSPANSNVRFTGGTAFTNVTDGTTVGTNSVLAIDQAELTRGTITLSGGSIAIEGTRSTTFGPDVTISVLAGTGTVGRYSATAGVGNLTNQGLLQATGSNAVLTINPTGSFTNMGSILTTTPSARLNIAAGGTFSSSGIVNARGTVQGDVTVTGGSFVLNGTVSGNLQVAGGAVGSGQAGVGMLTVGSAEFGPGGGYRWQIQDWSMAAIAGVGYDQISSNGSLDLSQLTGTNQFNIQIVGLDQNGSVGAVSTYTSAVARSWVIGHFSNDLSGLPADRFSLDSTIFAASNGLNGGTFSMALTSSGDLVLTFTPVPEPASILAVSALGIAAMQLRRRTRLSGRSNDRRITRLDRC